MELVKTWAANSSKITHAIAVLIVTAVTAFHEVPAFHDFVMSSYGAIHNAHVKSAVEAVGALYLWYSGRKALSA